MNGSSFTPKRILVTGASGAVGSAVWRALRQRGHQLRNFSLTPVADLPADSPDNIVGDLTDWEKVRQAMDGMEVLVHLAAYPLSRGDFLKDLLNPNVIGLYHVLEAAAQAKVQRIILASSVQVCGFIRRQIDRPLRPEDPPAPMNHYALTKLWAEEMGRMYAQLHQVAVLAVRIGWFVRNAEEAQRMQAGLPRSGNVYLSHDDAGRFFVRAVEADRPAPGEFAVLFALSKPVTQAWADPQPARDLIGYEAQDTWPQGLGFSF